MFFLKQTKALSGMPMTLNKWNSL